MKTLLTIIITAIICLPFYGQDETTEPLRYNEVRLGVLNLVGGTFHLGYERALGNRTSVALHAGYKGKEGLLQLSGLDTDQFKTGDLTYSGARIIPEFRYYLNERTSGMLTGFYFGAYATIVSYNSDFEGDYINENGTFPFEYDVKIRTNSLGLMVGYKLVVSKRFNIDFLIAGPGAGSYRVTVDEVVPAPDEFWFDLNEELEAYSILDLLNSDFDFSAQDRKESLILPSFRYGITLGYSF